ncbi:tetratricopeptide repeat protein [Pseudogemmobacter sp. W21_MBD1_M6]|uniref:tetratricopeptide repeat protein n=1 Tax=Pseudogemmobacter sp. W21_MBD1_M6 TaxID=3240271 RepID=UPI003F94F39E
MRHPVFLSLCLSGAMVLTACQDSGKADVERAVKSVNVIDESNLNDIMLTAGDPNEAVTYFNRSLAENPDRTDLQRGLAISFIRAKRPAEGTAAWAKVVAAKDSTDDDKVSFADALIRNGDWTRAEEQLNSVPPTVETYKRYRLEAMVADSKKDWKKADSFYETAVGLTTTPGSVLNNWGFSKLTRGDYTGAEKLFGQALNYDKDLFTAKNNLVLSRAAQRKYDMPILPMTQIERAQLLHTMALSAIKQGDVATGKSLLQQAIDTHPQYFEAAVRSLNALDANVTN